MLPHRTTEQFAYSKASWLFSWRRLWRFGVLVNRILPIRSSEASGRHGSRPAVAPRRRSDATPCANAAPGACPSRATRSRSFCWTRAGSRGGLPRVHARALPHVAGPARKARAKPSASLLTEFPDRLQHRAGSPRAASDGFAVRTVTGDVPASHMTSPRGDVQVVL